MTLEDVHKQFVEKGAVEIGRYYQKGRIDKLQSQSVKSKVQGGYCGGVCMDWIRRALVGQKLTFNEDKHYQDHRAAEAQILLTPAKKNAFADARESAMNNQKLPYATANTQLEKQRKALQTQWQMKVNSVPNLPQDKKNEAIDRANQLMEQLDQITVTKNANTDAINQATAEWNTWTSEPIMVRYWQTFAGEMNKLMELQRQERSKEGPSRSGFDKLRVITATDTKEYHKDQTTSAMTKLIDEAKAGLSTGLAVHVGIYPPTGSGHAIALLRVAMFNYIFFDPNFGTYRLKTDDLSKAVPWLFSDGYPSVTVAKPTDAHAYEVNGKVKGAFTIFAGPLT